MRRSVLDGLPARRFVIASALAAVTVAGACDGPNAFSGPVGIEEDRPRVDIVLPGSDETAIGVIDQLNVAAEVRDNEGIDSVVFYGVFLPTQEELELGTGSEVAKFGKRTVTSLANPRSDSIARELIPVDTTTKRSATIVVEAYDSDANMAADSVLVQIGGPTVQLLDLANGQLVRPGQTLGLRALIKDPEGIASMDFTVTGAVDTVINVVYPLPVDSTIVEESIILPTGSSVNFIEVGAGAINSLDPPLTGRSERVRLTLSDGAVTDTIPPRPALTVVQPATGRVELGDSIEVQVTGSDPSGDGVVLTGVTVIADGANLGTTVVYSDEVSEAAPNQGTVSRAFWIPILAVDSVNLPDTINYEVTGWMEDAAGNCGAAVNETLSFRCETLPTGERVALDQEGFKFSFLAVRGRTVLLPQGGSILDAEVDDRPGSRRLFLSNNALGQVEVFDLETETFGSPIRVGSQPWGLTFNAARDSLWVANSASTSFSLIDLDNEREVDNQRLLTPDVFLFDVRRQVDQEAGVVTHRVEARPKLDGSELAFSDRPQYAATDRFGNIIYSTVTTGVGELGTVRKAYVGPGFEQAEAKLFVEHAIPESQPDVWAVAHADDAGTLTNGDAVVVDHVPGFLSQNRSTTAFSGTIDPPFAPFGDADTRIYPGSWDLDVLGFKDTTYVAAATDGSFVAIGEGGSGDIAKVLVYEAAPLEQIIVSNARQVQDLLSNASESVKGVAVNYDGSLVAARGDAAYFFDTDLRLFNDGNISVNGNARGIAFHPLHANFRSNTNQVNGIYIPDVHLAFAPTGDNAVEIIDTFRGGAPIGRVSIKDVINGPLRAIGPFPNDNVGRTCATTAITDRNGGGIGSAIQIYQGRDFNQPIPPDGISEDGCVVVNLFGTTTSGGVVIIPVTKADVLRAHPSRVN